MNRGRIVEVIEKFHARYLASLVADEALLQDVVAALDEYIDELRDSYDEIDKFSLYDFCTIYSSYEGNKKYIYGSDKLVPYYSAIESKVLDYHRELSSCGIELSNPSWRIRDLL